MIKAYDVMTHALATCPPDATVSHVANLMRDRDIGDVLVVENGNLRGIVTDRDLALQALTGKIDPSDTPIHKFMSTKVVTGNSDWNIKQVANKMAKHQVRRLPIVQDGQLVGIISLGDIARHDNQKDIASKSLNAISKPADNLASQSSRRAAALLGVGLATLATTVITFLTWHRNSDALRKQIAQSKPYQSAQEVVRNTRSKVDDAQANSSKLVRNLSKQMRSNFKDISAQLPRIEYKPPKHRSFLSRLNPFYRA